MKIVVRTMMTLRNANFCGRLIPRRHNSLVMQQPESRQASLQPNHYPWVFLPSTWKYFFATQPLPMSISSKYLKVLLCNATTTYEFSSFHCFQFLKKTSLQRQSLAGKWQCQFSLHGSNGKQSPTWEYFFSILESTWEYFFIICTLGYLGVGKGREISCRGAGGIIILPRVKLSTFLYATCPWDWDDDKNFVGWLYLICVKREELCYKTANGKTVKLPIL